MSTHFDVKAFFAGREHARFSFLQKHLGETFFVKSLTEDWASRRYFRVIEGDKTFVLMETVPDHIQTATMGHKLSAFLKIAKLLHDHGIHAPDILQADERDGFILLEDLGNTSVNAALDQGGDQMKLYEAATDVLITMRDRITLNDLCNFPKYKDSYIHKGRQRIVDWYMPATRQVRNADGMVESFIAAWDEIAASLPPPPIGFVHGDYHPGNLMLLSNGTCGVLDFQDAMAGPLPYDLANLIENIRRDVPKDVHDAMLKRYGGDENFRAWFRVMATQFHCRIIGQVIRLAVLSDKTDLLQYMPRIQNYISEGLKDPVLKPLADWFRAEKVDLAAQHFQPDLIRAFIREDAF